MFALIGTEVPELVFLDRATNRATILLVRKRKNRLLNGVGGIEIRVAEISKSAAVQGIRTGLTLHIHIDPSRTSGRRIETVGNDLELGDRVLGELRLPEARSHGIL